MKNNITKIALGAFIALGVLNSCDTDNVNPLQTAGTDEFGAYARVTSISDDTNANITNVSASSFDVAIEFVDSENGTLVTDYNIYATFRDQTIADEDAPDYSITDEVLIYSYDSSEFTSGEDYPQFSFTISAEDAISALGLDLDVAEGGDALNYRGEIILSDGRTFSSTNSGVSINSELFYNDAFSFTSQFVCLFDTPPPGDYIVDMVDTYGDGWQGDGIKITIDGEAVYADIPDYWSTGLGPYAELSTTITIPEGTTTATWEFTGDTYASEVEFKIYGPSGNLIAEESGPSVGAITLNLCKESL